MKYRVKELVCENYIYSCQKRILFIWFDVKYCENKTFALEWLKCKKQGHKYYY
jgi:hypothetical protein